MYRLEQTARLQSLPTNYDRVRSDALNLSAVRLQPKFAWR